MKSLLSAYIIFGLLVLGYFLKIVLNQRVLNREIKTLKDKLTDGL